jgi:hypothetical protein
MQCEVSVLGTHFWEMLGIVRYALEARCEVALTQHLRLQLGLWRPEAP